MDHEILGSDIPVDDDFESYVAGSDINGQGRWFVAKNDPTCTSLIVDRSGNQWLELYDTTPPPQNIIEAGMNLTDNNASKGFARFLFESDDTTDEVVIMLNDGVMSQIGSLITPNASARIRVSSGFFFTSDGNVFTNVAPASSNTVYEIEIHYKLDEGWHAVINGTQYDNGADYSYSFAFGQPNQMNVFEVVTGTSSSDYSIYLDDVDFSWTPNDNAPTIERVEYVETAFNGTTLVNFTANYTDLDNNPPVFMNLSINSTLYEMQQVVPNDQNYTDGCLYTCSLVFNDTGNLTYFFNGSDGTTAVSTNMFELEVIEEEPLYFDGMLYEWTGCFGWTGVREQGYDLFGETGSGTNIFHVESEPANSFSGNRDINGTTGVITSTSGMIWQPWIGARDWVKLPRDIGVGTSVRLGLVNGGEQTFTIQEQRYYPAAGIMHACWYMTSVQGSHAYYDKFSGLLVNLSIVPPFPENNYTIQIRDTNVPRIENSNPVILSGVSVDPASATQDTEFTFNITCTDADKTPPASVDILIDGMPHPMIRVNESDIDASDGILYTYSTYLQPGTYNYSMNASDGIYWDQTMNASITVTSSNGNTPVLSGGSVSPLSGYNGTSRFRFWVQYTDADNNVPLYVNVSVNGTQYSLQKAVRTDDNFMDGCIYERTIPFMFPGNYSYLFECSDGLSLGSDGPYVGPVVNGTNAAFFDGMVYKWDGYFKLFGSDELHYWGKEYFNQTNATHYQVLSTPMNWMGPMNRDVDGLTMEVTNGFYPMNTIEWVKISTDISMGSSVPIAVFSAFEAENFIVTGETLFTTNGGSFDCWILEAPSGHVAYYDKYSGMLVNGTYFTFMGGMEEFTLQFMDTNIPLRPNLHAPELDNALVSPASGNQSTAFTFSVNYTDADNDAPEFVHVKVNETIYSMNLQDPSDDNFTDGANYRTIVYLAPGTYNYTFKCSDWVHVNSTSTYPGLVITETNSQPPELTAGMVNPDHAFNGSTMVTFSVIYTDLDNNAPVYINVTINSTVYNLSKEDITDLDYMDGCLYSLSLILNDTGNYTYHFNASDGITAVGLGPFMNLEVEEKSILFFDGMMYNYTAYFSWTDAWHNVTENCVEMGSNIFNINSSLRSSLWGNRTVDGATRILTDDLFSDFNPGTHEWSRIFSDVGMGGKIPISTAWKPVSQQFTVVGETIFFSMGHAFECWVLESSRGEVAYYDKYSSILVNGTFLVNMGPGSTEFYTFQVTGTNIPLKPNTGAPQLENGTVIPASGDQADLYNFTVLYSDPDDNAPFYVNVSINGSQHQMLPVSPEHLDFKDGVLYSCTTYLSPGNYSYSFNTMDGLFSNSTGVQAGPTVSETNVASPSLLNVTVTPDLGSNITIFTFSVIYKDADNNLPAFIEVEVNGSSYPMVEVNPWDLDVTDGKAYQYQSTLVEGFHQFQVRCSDGINPAATPWIEKPQVSPLFHYVNYTVFHEDFESDLSQWDTISGFWHQTGINSSWPDSFHSVNQSAWFGRELFGSYANGSRAYGSLITKPIDLTIIPAAYLEFYHWRNAMVPDESLISISIDGINWDDIFSSISVISPWEKVVLNISQYCGNQSVRIRFMFDTIDGWDNNYRGWLVDDIKVYSNISSIVPLHPVNGGNVINGLFNFTWSSLDITALPVNFSHELSSHENFSTLIINDTDILETPINTSNLALLDLEIGSYYWRVSVQHGSFESYSSTFTLIMPDRTPVADFTENTTTIYQGEFIQFTFNGTEGNLPMTYQWDFGDGSALGSGVNPVHQYNSSGDFTVTLIVTDKDSDSDVKVKFLHIHVLVDLIPIVNFTVNESIILVNDQVQFNFTGSEGNLPVSYQWNFNDSTPNATTKNPVHQFTTEGTYNITLTIQDANGDIATLKQVGMVTVVVDRFPEANFTANITTIYKGDSVQFNFTGTEGDAPATFQWNFTDGTANATSKNPVHQFNIDGNFSIICTVQDLDGDIDSIQRIEYIQVIDRIPTASFLVNATVVRVNVDIQFNFTGTEGDAPASFQWNFTDGTTNATSRNPIHSFSSEGNYTVILTVVDDDGDQDTISLIDYIQVIPDPQPYANFTANITTVVIGDFVQFNFTGSEGDAPATFQWNFTDGTANSTSRNPVHQYNTLGNYTVILTVIDLDGDSNTSVKVDYIHVIQPDFHPVANFTANLTTIGVNDHVQFNFTGFEGDSPAIFQWNFTDGSLNSSAENPSHQFTSFGNFTVILTVIDDDGDEDSLVLVDFISVIDLKPISNFDVNDSTIYQGEWVQFNFTGFEGDAPCNYQWNFGDGSPQVSEKNPVHQYNNHGTFSVLLIITDDDGDPHSEFKINFMTVIEDIEPVANFSANLTSPVEDQEVGFTFSGISGNAPINYQWNFGDGSPNSSLQEPTHVYNTSGNYTVVLTLLDDSGDRSSIEKVNFITVLPDLFPVPAFVSNYTSKIQPGDSIAFTYTGTMGNGILSFQWNFGDGTGNKTSQNPVHDFNTEGIFTVVLTVSDIDGDSETYIMPGPITVEVETFMNKVLDFLKDNLLLVIIAIGGVALVSVVGVRRRQSVKQKAAVGASKKEKTISKKTMDEILKQIKHLFVFHRKTSACLLYQPFTEKTTDPQLIAGFISAISSFGGTFDKKAKLKVLEYQSFKIILEETLLASYALLFEGQMDEMLKEHFSKFIMIFENKYQDEISGFRGDLTPFNDAGDITKRIFKIDRPLQQACITKKTKARGKTFNLYCARCKEWKPQAPDTSIEGSETCNTCDSALYFVPRCYKCGHSILKPLDAFTAFKKDPETCEKCGGPMYIQ